MKNEYEQETEKCFYFDKQCHLKDYNGICVIFKGQYCRRYKDVDDSKRVIKEIKIK